MLNELCLIYGEKYVACAFAMFTLAMLGLWVWIGYKPKRRTPVSENTPVKTGDTACQTKPAPCIVWVSKYAFLRSVFHSGFSTVYIMANSVDNYMDTLKYLGIPPVASFKGGLQYRWLHPSLSTHVRCLRERGGVVVMGYGAASIAGHVIDLLDDALGTVESDMAFYDRVRYLMAGKEAGAPRVPQNRRGGFKRAFEPVKKRGFVS